MVTIPGASQFLGASTLANLRGTPAQQSNVLGEGSATSLLDVGRSLATPGVGLSASARQLNSQFIESSKTQFNALFSLGIGQTSSIEGLQQQILALRSSLPDSKISDGVVPIGQDDGGVAEGETGQAVDTEA